MDGVLSYIDTGPDQDTAAGLVFLHGLMMNKEVWEHQIDYFSGKYRVIAIDLAGFGQSAATSSRSSYATHARDVHNLLQNLGMGNVHLVGWSMGAVIAIHFAELFPSELHTLTLANTCPKATSSEDFPWGVDADKVAMMMELIETDRKNMTEVFVGQILPDSADKDLHEKMFRCAYNTRPEVTLHHLEIALQSDLRPMLGKILAPTLLINGELDVFSMTGANEYMLQQITNADWAEIAGAGHAPFLTQPDTFNACLERFLANAG